MSDSREAMRAAVEALPKLLAIINRVGCLYGLNAEERSAQEKGAAALSLLRAALEAREEPAGLRNALLAMVYEDGGRWYAGIKPDADVTDLVVPALAASPAAATQGDAKDAARYRWLRKNHEVTLIVSWFGNGCVNKTIDDAEAKIDAAIGAESERATENKPS